MCIRGPWKNTRSGDTAVFQCRKEIIRKRIRTVHRGSIKDLFSRMEFRRIIPAAKDAGDALAKIERFILDAKSFWLLSFTRTEIRSS